MITIFDYITIKSSGESKINYVTERRENNTAIPFQNTKISKKLITLRKHLLLNIYTTCSFY